MTTLVAGASGATGKHLVEQLLKLGQNVKVIVRPTSQIPDSWSNNSNITIIRGDISEMSHEEMRNHVKGCQGVASCLGHNMTFKGIFGKPRKLVKNAVELMCMAIQQTSPGKPVRFVLMNTVGNRNRDINEPVSAGQKLVIGLIRLLLPPHSDNEKAADYLRLSIGQKNKFIEWAAVRPDSLIDNDMVSEYDVHASPIRSAIFNPGKTSRINVGNFMARLLVEKELWDQWKGQMPVVYNRED